MFCRHAPRGPRPGSIPPAAIQCLPGRPGSHAVESERLIRRGGLGRLNRTKAMAATHANHSGHLSGLARAADSPRPLHARSPPWPLRYSTDWLQIESFVPAAALRMVDAAVAGWSRLNRAWVSRLQGARPRGGAAGLDRTAGAAAFRTIFPFSFGRPGGAFPDATRPQRTKPASSFDRAILRCWPNTTGGSGPHYPACIFDRLISRDSAPPAARQKNLHFDPIAAPERFSSEVDCRFRVKEKPRQK